MSSTKSKVRKRTDKSSPCKDQKTRMASKQDRWQKNKNGFSPKAYSEGKSKAEKNLTDVSKKDGYESR